MSFQLLERATGNQEPKTPQPTITLGGFCVAEGHRLDLDDFPCVRAEAQKIANFPLTIELCQ